MRNNEPLETITEGENEFLPSWPAERIRPESRIICAVDTTDLDEALLLAQLLAGEVGALKLGSEFFTTHGPHGLEQVAKAGHRIFLDLKYHDIPNTVAGAVRAASALPVDLLTVHASGGPAMLEAAAEAARSGPRRLAVIAVSVLTSLDNDDLGIVGQQKPVSEQVLRLARLAESSGLDGLVCSPREALLLRELPSLTLVVPGVRPLFSDTGDQKRFATPSDAIANGADRLVIGRPITRSDDPVGSVRFIASEISRALEQ